MYYFIPLVAFILLARLLYVGLQLDPKQVPSVLIDKPVPEFVLPQLQPSTPTQTMTQDSFKGQVSLLNVWATWCVSCRQEHELLLALKQQGVTIYGLNYKDNREEALQWLQQYGDPYLANGFDEEGRVGINWGVYGTPETFVIDDKGVIRHKFIGPLTPDIIASQLLPLLQQLKAELRLDN